MKSPVLLNLAFAIEFRAFSKDLPAPIDEVNFNCLATTYAGLLAIFGTAQTLRPGTFIRVPHEAIVLKVDIHSK
jgi:hypothetical protein